jgi:alkylation response protein AidB-like acyl-CoA dehydrogenase
MDLLPTGEQQQIIDSAASFLTDRVPLRRLHAKTDPADQLPPDLWRQCAEMGWLGMALHEDAGGVGYTVVEEALVFLEFGRVLAPPRLLFTSLAGKVAAAAGQPHLAGRLAAGELTAALAVQDDYDGPAESLAQRRLFEVAQADVALAIDGDTVRLIDISRLNFEPRGNLDASISMAVADLSGAPVLCSVEAPQIRQAGSVLAAAMLVGLSETARDMIVEYAKIRVTFGRPIGAYQAVRHPCADMAVRCVEARSQLFVAAIALADGRADADVQVAGARVLAEQAALKNADDNIQLHGGIGVTDEFDAHFLIKRANAMTSWLGDRRSSLERILNSSLNAVATAQ